MACMNQTCICPNKGDSQHEKQYKCTKEPLKDVGGACDESEECSQATDTVMCKDHHCECGIPGEQPVEGLGGKRCWMGLLYNAPCIINSKFDYLYLYLYYTVHIIIITHKISLFLSKRM